MTKFKSILFTVIAAGILVSVSAATAHAQNLSAKNTQWFTNNPCSNPNISWALWNESMQQVKPSGGIDCNPANYGSWNNAQQLEANLRAYRDSLRKQNVTISAPSLASDRHTYQSVMKNGSVAFRIDYGLVAQGGGNLVAQGGGNIISTNSANLVATGGGNFRGVMAAGDTVVQLPGRWIKVTKR